MSSPSTIEVASYVLRAVRFDNEKARKPVFFEGTALELIGSQHAARSEKKGTPAFSAATYHPEQTRGNDGIAEVTAVVLDFDHLARASVDEVRRRLAERGWAWVGYSSFSHLAEGGDDHCFRLLVFVSRPMATDEYDTVWFATNNALGSFADRNARDASRLWFVASCPPERLDAAWIRWSDGRPLDVDAALAAHARRQRRTPPPVRSDDVLLPGTRNASLASLAGVVRRRGVDREGIVALLRAVNASRCQPPLPDEEILGIATSVSRYLPRSPLLTANRTDLGNAERFDAFAGDRFRYVHAWGSWLRYDGARWQHDGDGHVVRTARDLLRTMAAAAEGVADEGERDELVKHALDSESSGRISSMLSLSQALLPMGLDALDRDPDLLNVANGTLDLRTGKLRPHASSDYLTHLAPVPYDPDARCPQWEAFLGRILQGNEALIGFLQRAVGYSLTGHTGEQVLLLLYGVGANGKSTFLETIRALMGDYAIQADFTTFLKRDTDGARNDLARLVGTRFVSAVEAEAGKPLAEPLVKQLTGGDTITARFLFKEFFDYKPAFKIWLAANCKPTVVGTDHGIWRRLRLVPFTVIIPEPERDKALPARLLEELPGILAWAVRGCLRWRAEGLGLPEAVRAATDSYREEMDALGPFLDETCALHTEATTTAKELYVAYAAWCESNGEKARSQKAVAAKLRERGFDGFKGAKGVRCWRGLRVRGPLEPGGGWRVGGASDETRSEGEPPPAFEEGEL